MRWMNLEYRIKEVRAKDRYYILKCIYGIYKDSTDDPVCTAAKETQT